MRLILKIRMDNDAFVGCGYHESARLLHDAADRLELGQREGVLRDSNGNDVGTYAIKAGETEPCQP